MENKTFFISTCMNLVVQSKMRGEVPLVFVVSPMTFDLIRDEMIPQLKKVMPWWVKLRTKFFGYGKTREMIVAGVPVVRNMHMRDDMINLQTVPPNHPATQEAPELRRGTTQTPFWSESDPSVRPEASGKQGGGNPSLDDLSRGSGDRPSCTDILIKAMTGIDSVDRILVARVHTNGDIDTCMNCNSLEAPGIIQRVQIYLSMRGY